MFSKYLRTEVTIDASCSQVWRALSDFERYTLWNPFVIEAKGEAIEGAVVPIVIQLHGQKAQPYKVKILERREQECLRWLGHFKIKGLCDGSHRFLLQKTEEGGCLLIHDETFSGLLVPLIWPSLGPRFKISFEGLNQSLKQYIESRVAEMKN